MGKPSNSPIRIPVNTTDLRIIEGQVVIVCKCPKCRRTKDINDFGVRKMGGGEIRRQSYCRTCRSKGKNAA